MKGMKNAFFDLPGVSRPLWRHDDVITPEKIFWKIPNSHSFQMKSTLGNYVVYIENENKIKVWLHIILHSFNIGSLCILVVCGSVLSASMLSSFLN